MNSIDYSGGTANVDLSNGIHYGVIPAAAVLQSWDDSSEGYYGEPTCPECGTETHHSIPDDQEEDEYSGTGDNYCYNCKKVWWSEDVYGEQALSWEYEGDGYKAVQNGDDTDIFIMSSLYYTRAEFCSPCAPGAGYLLNSTPDEVKAYCFSHDWFDEGVAPYPVYLVADGSLVEV